MTALPNENVLPISAKPVASVMFVSPEMAQRWLGYNTRNRKVRERFVNEFARDMAAGNWRLTGEAIKFGIDGALLDGQHRLAAIVRSGATIPTLVVRGIANEAQDRMDTGNARTASDMLSLHGHASTAMLAAAAKLALGVEAEAADPGRHRPTHGEISDFVAANPTLIDAVEFARPISRKTDAPPSVVAYTYWRLAQIDVIDAANFWLSASEKVGLTAGDPVLALTNRFAESRRNREQLSKRIYLSLIYRAWNYRRDGKTCRMLRVNSPAGGLVPIPEPK